MSDINWDSAPEGATEIVQYEPNKALRWAKKDSVWSFVNEAWKHRHESWQTIATRPQPERKTVEDAVEHFKGVWPDTDSEVLCYDNEEGWGAWFINWTPCFEYYQVCTREEFEVCVAAKAKSEPEWDGVGLPPVGIKCLHMDGVTEKWKEVYTIGTHAFDEDTILYCEKNETGYVFYGYKGDFKPIKPTITKAEMLDKIQKMGQGVASDGHFGDTVRGWFDEYTITD